ncbi:MAG: 16S rRNA (uracil(1498)-N(3))-methyltransferase [Vicinamibacterales bacterium]
MRPRFYLPGLDEGGSGTLTGDEAAHLTRVLRLGVGDDIDVFDGAGRMFHARVEDVAGGHVRVRAVGPAPSAPEAALRVTLVMAVLKGDKMDDVVRDATMMGVVALQPIVTARSEVRLAALARAHRMERWKRIAISSAKQCGRATVPDVRPPVELRTWIVESADRTDGGRSRPESDAVIVLQEPSLGVTAALGDVPRAPGVQLAVGPEGGWAEDERAAFEAARFRAVSLGGRTLRADVAPVVAMAALFEAWQGW